MEQQHEQSVQIDNLTDLQKDLVLSAGDYRDQRLEIEDALHRFEKDQPYQQITELYHAQIFQYEGQDQPPGLTERGQELYTQLDHERGPDQRPPVRERHEAGPFKDPTVFFDRSNDLGRDRGR